ncbi:MarR family winged helix-turn-helix transcriptional regulator [Azohydromonas sediminis]|uniref:MarR family winged helix-turn-helix transcriptional regulator n=1 Tax=Azohydromonas sediminis TaxID=2259674 RepID=UPI000E65E831|nr:MarR family transcriptional regulator [Azohydromonas sediminis]
MRPFLDDHLVYLLARASHALWRGFEPRVRDAGLSSLEWRVMAVLADREPLPVGTLAREVLAKQPTLTKALDRMAQQGWIERRADPDDARRARVALTRAGRERVAPLLAAAASHEARQLADVPAAERKRLQRQLRAIIDRFDADEPPS